MGEESGDSGSSTRAGSDLFLGRALPRRRGVPELSRPRVLNRLRRFLPGELAVCMRRGAAALWASLRCVGAEFSEGPGSLRSRARVTRSRVGDGILGGSGPDRTRRPSSPGASRTGHTHKTEPRDQPQAYTELRGSQALGVVSNSCFDRVLLPILYMFRPSRRPMFEPPSLGPLSSPQTKA